MENNDYRIQYPECLVLGRHILASAQRDLEQFKIEGTRGQLRIILRPGLPPRPGMGHPALEKNRREIRLQTSRTETRDEGATEEAPSSEGSFRKEVEERRPEIGQERVGSGRSRGGAERGALAPAEETSRSSEQVGQVLGDRMEVALLHEHIRIRTGNYFIFF